MLTLLPADGSGLARGVSPVDEPGADGFEGVAVESNESSIFCCCCCRAVDFRVVLADLVDDGAVAAGVVA